MKRSVGTSAFPSGFFRKERSSRTNGSCHSEVPPRYGYDESLMRRKRKSQSARSAALGSKKRWIVETFGDGLRHTLLAPPDYYAKQQREAEQRLAGPRFSRPRSHKPQVTAGGLRPPRFTSHSALCFSFRLELRLHVTAVLATGRLPYL